jgi:hypothetical protein
MSAFCVVVISEIVQSDSERVVVNHATSCMYLSI